MACTRINRRQHNGSWVHLKTQAVLNLDLLDALWREHDPATKRRLLQLMVKFGLAVPQRKRSTYLVPALLQDSEDAVAEIYRAAELARLAPGAQHTAFFVFSLEGLLDTTKAVHTCLGIRAWGLCGDGDLDIHGREEVLEKPPSSSVIELQALGLKPGHARALKAHFSPGVAAPGLRIRGIHVACGAAGAVHRIVPDTHATAPGYSPGRVSASRPPTWADQQGRAGRDRGTYAPQPRQPAPSRRLSGSSASLRRNRPIRLAWAGLLRPWQVCVPG
eukprot:COSAG04_NODE_8223_length_1005_cov_1.302428_2_plen_275_part_00